MGPPKTASGEERRVDLDSATAGSLIAHRLRQDAEKAAFGAAYEDRDLVFAREDAVLPQARGRLQDVPRSGRHGGAAAGAAA